MHNIIIGRNQQYDLDLDADVVIVGSGAGGAVAAQILSAAGRKVLIFEEGPYVSGAQHGAMRVSESIRHVWRDGAMSFVVGIGDSPFINVTMGRCVGGSSVLTGGVCFRTPEHILEHWSRDFAIPEVSVSDMEPFFEKVEHAVHVEEVPIAMRSRSTQLFGEGTEKLGFSLKSLKRNTKNCNGCGKCNFGCPHQAKLSVDQTYLPRALAQGAHLFTDAYVSRITLKNRVATGIEGYFLDGPLARKTRKFRVHADQVIVASGSLHTPLLLMRSGLGQVTPNVGKNLTLHPAFRVIARFDESVRGWRGSLQSAYSDRYKDDHMTMVGLFIPPSVLTATMPGVGPRLMEAAKHVDQLALFGGLIHDDAGGQVRAAIGREPLITYAMSKRNRAAMPQLMRRMSEIFFAAGAKEVFIPVLGEDGFTADRLRRFDLEHVPAKRFECSSQHPLGTCRMGADARTSVVDPFGAVWGIDQLHLCDGSIIPSSLGVNPQETIMAMATRVIERLVTSQK